MDIKPLSIKLVRQEPQSDDCLRACAYMVFKYFKEEVTKDEVWKNIHVYKKHSGLFGGYLQDLGVYAIRKGYKTTIYHYGYKKWNEDVAKAMKTGKKTIAALTAFKKEQEDWIKNKELGKDVRFLKKGGIFKFQPPQTTTIDSILKKRLPVIALVQGCDLYKSPKENYVHTIVVIGRKGGKYIIKDPYMAIEEISEKDLIFDISRGGWMMSLFPLRKKKTLKAPSAKQTKLKF
jgi:ABC-type bacteriocin/lantibiotic exporter with double-glycine peptidase domain